MNWQRILLVVGVGMAALGLLAFVAPDAFTIDVGQAAITGVAVLALLFGLWTVYGRSTIVRQQATTPDLEQTLAVSPPGAELQDATRMFWEKPHEFYRLSSREGLRAAAVAVLTRYRNLSTEEATERLDEETWTDDTIASEFLNKQNSTLSLSRNLRTLLRLESSYQRGVRRTVSSIAEIAGVPSETTTANSDNQEHKTQARGKDNTQAYGESSTRGSEKNSGRQPTRSGTGLRARRETRRWHGISAVVLISLGIGVLLERPGILLVGVVGLCYGAYAHSHDITPRTLSVDRELSDDAAESGDEIAVTVTVTNDGDHLLPDIRVVDGVPDGLAVSDGSPRLGTALRPDETATFTYTVTARRGVHEFDPALAIVRNLPGTVEYEYLTGPEQPTELVCTPELQELPVSVPLRAASTQYTGVQPTTASGEGTEFYATRLYQTGDSMSRIDWNRQAKTGELATLLFREERTTTVVLLVDNHLDAYVAPEPHGDHAVDRSITAAGQLFTSITNEGHFVGITALTDTDCWLEPGTGPTHRVRARDLLATHPALQPVRSETQENPIRARWTLRSRLPSTAQIVVFSPLCRQSIVRYIRQLEAAGYPVTVVSPDATTTRTPSQQLATVGRRIHITDLRRDGVPVVDWDWDEPLATAIARFAKQQEQIR